MGNLDRRKRGSVSSSTSFTGLETDPLLGPSRVIREVRDRVSKIAAQRLPVFIDGESGTGRQFVARQVHQLSQRSHAPFQAFDCSSVPEGLLARELFGHSRGAFTGADVDDIGRLRAASGGSFYLHAIDHLPPSGQCALLRVIQFGEFTPLGETNSTRVDLRFIESSDRSLPHQVRDGSFRMDLYYRLNGLKVELPPLRERPEDVSFYIEWLLQKHARIQGRSIPRVRDDLRRLFQSDPWPGNLPELEGAIESTLVQSEGDLLTPHQLPNPLLARLEDRGDAPSGTRTFSIPAQLEFAEQVTFFQRILLQRVWRECGRDRTRLAARLGLERHQLRYWVQMLDGELR